MLNATAVKKSIEYFLDTPNTNSSAVGPISKVDAVDDDTVRVHYSSAYPNAVSSLTQFYGLGMVIGPDGLKNPSSLDTTPDGVGQYKLNTGSTVSNSVYTYDANAAYFRPKAVRFKTVQVKVLPDNNARLAALKSGQIDYAVQLPLAQLGSKAAGDRRVLKSPSTWMVLFFANRASGPLAEPDVRKALNHAIDRKSLATGLYGGYALAQDQFSPTGAKGYDSDLGGTYSFDTAEAKSLLAKAGYANGLKIKVLDNGTVDPNGLLGAALKEQLAKVGVTVDLEVFSGPFNQFTTELTSNKYDAYVWNMFSQDMYTAANLYFAGSGMLNTYKLSDNGADALIDKAAMSSAADSTAAYQELNRYLTDNAWGAPVVTRLNTDVVSRDITVPLSNPVTPAVDPVAPQPELAWSPGRTH
jgi:peptide/nickel transport system substrate-binding protein